MALLAGAAVHGDAVSCLDAKLIYSARWATKATVPAMGALAAWLGVRMGRTQRPSSVKEIAISAACSTMLWAGLFLVFRLAHAKAGKLEWTLALVFPLGITYTTVYGIVLWRGVRAWNRALRRIESLYSDYNPQAWKKSSTEPSPPSP